MRLQKLFFTQNKWLIDPQDPVFYTSLYSFPKICVVLLGAGALILLLLNLFKFIKLRRTKVIGLISFLICIVLFPTVINLLKDLMRQPCPRDLSVFGGSYSGSLIDFLQNRGDIKCFPGAHASAPFSLISMTFLFEDRYNQLLFLTVLIPMATIVSMYQVARGVHFISDSLFTACFSWLFAQLVFSITKKLAAR